MQVTIYMYVTVTTMIAWKNSFPTNRAGLLRTRGAHYLNDPEGNRFEF